MNDQNFYGGQGDRSLGGGVTVVIEEFFQKRLKIGGG